MFQIFFHILSTTELHIICAGPCIEIWPWQESVFNVYPFFGLSTQIADQNKIHMLTLK